MLDDTGGMRGVSDPSIDCKRKAVRGRHETAPIIAVGLAETAPSVLGTGRQEPHSAHWQTETGADELSPPRSPALMSLRLQMLCTAVLNCPCQANYSSLSVQPPELWEGGVSIEIESKAFALSYIPRPF